MAGDDAEVGDPFGDQAHDLVAEALLQVDADIGMGGEERAQRLRQELGQRIGIGEHPDLAGEPAGIGPEVLAQPLGLAQHRARVLEQRAAGLRRRHAMAPSHEQCRPQRLLHVANARGGCGQSEMRPLGAAGDAAGFDGVAKQAEIGQVETHGLNPWLAALGPSVPGTPFCLRI